MEISEVRIRLIPNRGNEDRLRAFCSITFDGEFVIRDLKVIEGTNGIFVAMPSRKLADHCQRCGAKNHLRARFCNECGAKLNRARVRRDSENRPKYHADVAHPINSQCRERIEAAVRKAYEEELERSQQPGYKPAAYDDDEFSTSDYDDLIAELKRDASSRRRPAPEEPAVGESPEDERDDAMDHDVGPTPPPARIERKPEPVPPPPAPSLPQQPQRPDSDFGNGLF
jgi:stage V sporulation protein G